MDRLATTWLRWPTKFGKRVKLYGKTRTHKGTEISSHLLGSLTRNSCAVWKVIGIIVKIQTQDILLTATEEPAHFDLQSLRYLYMCAKKKIILGVPG